MIIIIESKPLFLTPEYYGGRKRLKNSRYGFFTKTKATILIMEDRDDLYEPLSPSAEDGAMTRRMKRKAVEAGSETAKAVTSKKSKSGAVGKSKKKPSKRTSSTKEKPAVTAGSSGCTYVGSSATKRTSGRKTRAIIANEEPSRNLRRSEVLNTQLRTDDVVDDVPVRSQHSKCIDVPSSQSLTAEERLRTIIRENNLSDKVVSELSACIDRSGGCDQGRDGDAIRPAERRLEQQETSGTIMKGRQSANGTEPRGVAVEVEAKESTVAEEGDDVHSDDVNEGVHEDGGEYEEEDEDDSVELDEEGEYGDEQRRASEAGGAHYESDEDLDLSVTMEPPRHPLPPKTNQRGQGRTDDVQLVPSTTSTPVQEQCALGNSGVSNGTLISKGGMFDETILKHLMEKIDVAVNRHVRNALDDLSSKLQHELAGMRKIEDSLADLNNLVTTVAKAAFIKPAAVLTRQKEIHSIICILPALFTEEFILRILSRCLICSAWKRHNGVSSLQSVQDAGVDIIGVLFFPASQENVQERSTRPVLGRSSRDSETGC